MLSLCFDDLDPNLLSAEKQQLQAEKEVLVKLQKDATTQRHKIFTDTMVLVVNNAAMRLEAGEIDVRMCCPPLSKAPVPRRWRRLMNKTKMVFVICHASDNEVRSLSPYWNVEVVLSNAYCVALYLPSDDSGLSRVDTV